MRQMKAIVMWMGVAALFAAAPSRVAAQTIVEHYHLDPIGSVRAVTDSNGSVVRRHDYQPFGEEAVPCTATAGADAQRFAGKVRDWESCLDYFEARQYKNVLGRFTSVDPGHVGGNIYNPQTWNAYAYAGNNPLRFVDPDGRRWFAREGQARWVDANADGTYTSPGEGWVELDPKNYNYKMNVAFVDGTLSFIGEDPSGRKMQAPWSSPEAGLEDTTFSFLSSFWTATTAVRSAVAWMAGSGERALTEIVFTTGKRARTPNLAANLTASQFQANLIASGFRVVPSSAGTTMLTNGQKTYTIYTSSRGVPSAQVKNASGILAKIRLTGW